MIRTLLLALWLLPAYSVLSQFSYDFQSLNNLENTDWKGQISHFIINESAQLQLNAPEAGSTFIYHPTNIPDSVEMHIYFKMDFSPSVNNKLRIYLQLDTFSLDIASGYYLEIGENGSEDRIRFARMLQGEELVIAEGTPGIFSEDPAEARLKILRDEKGYWKISVALNNSLLFQTELELFDSTLISHFDQYFGIQCFYTSSRKDKFMFDDIDLKLPIPDTIPPKLIDHKVLSSNTIELMFDEVLENIEVLQTDHFVLMDQMKSPSGIIFNEFKPNRILLQFGEEFESGLQYRLRILGLSDLNGNKILDPIYITFYLSESPQYSDLLITEVLFNPFENGEDFVEIYNNSSKVIALKSLLIQDQSKAVALSSIAQDYDLFPGKYLAISNDTSSLYPFYEIPDSAHLLENKLPPLNNDSGNVSLIWPNGDQSVMIDSFDYNEEMHFELIDDPEGISLERIFMEVGSNDPSNWYSASTLKGGASPGYKNSQFLDYTLPEKNYFQLDEKTLSPDNDAFQDNLLIRYRMPDSGFVGSITIFNSQGYFIRKLIDNELLGSDGILSWNGLDQSNAILPIGPYLLLCEIFHPNGEVTGQKLLCYLVEKLD